MLQSKTIKRVFVVPEAQFISMIAAGLNQPNSPVRLTGFCAEVRSNNMDQYILKMRTGDGTIQEFSYSTDDGGVLIDESENRYVVLDTAWK